MSIWYMTSASAPPPAAVVATPTAAPAPPVAGVKCSECRTPPSSHPGKVQAVALHPAASPAARAAPITACATCATLLLITLLMLVGRSLGEPLSSQEPQQLEPTSLTSVLLSKSAVIGIMSSTTNLHMRQMVRSTYGQYARPPVRIHVKFVIGLLGESAKAQAALKLEAQVYEDLVLLHGAEDAPEDPMKTYLKVIRFYAWAVSPQASHHYDYIIKADHDTYLHPLNLQRHISKLPSDDVYWGHVLPKGWFQIRDGPLIMSAYQQGGFYLLSRNLITWIAANRHCLLKLESVEPWEDQMSGLWVAAAWSLKQEALLGNNCTQDFLSSNVKPHAPETLMQMHAPTSEWYNLDFATTGATWWDPDPDMGEFNQDAQDGQPPLSTIAVHSLLSWSRFLWLHAYFVKHSYHQWRVCMLADFLPSRCHDLLEGAAYNKAWLRTNFMLDVGQDVGHLGSLAHHVAHNMTWV